MRTLIALSVLLLSSGLCHAQDVTGKTEEEIKKAIAEIYKELGGPPTIITSASASSEISASFDDPPVCGKTFTPQDVLNNGILITIKGIAEVKATAPAGTYVFHTYVKVSDGSGNIIREGFGQATIQPGQTDDFGYVDKITKCYCDATTLKIESSVSSISPKGEFRLHQYKACDVFIKPPTALSTEGQPTPAQEKPAKLSSDYVVTPIYADTGYVQKKGLTSVKSEPSYEVKSVWVESVFHNSKKFGGEDEPTENRFTVVLSSIEDDVAGFFWTNRTAEEADAILELYELSKKNGKPLYYFRDDDILGNFGI